MKRLRILFIAIISFMAFEAEAWHGVSPYAYCAGDPVNCVDVDGRDARVVIDGNNITISAAIVLTGSNASNDLAQIYQQGLEEMWGDLKTFVDSEGNSYNLQFVFSVTANPEIDIDNGSAPEPDGYHNYMQVVNKEYTNGTHTDAQSGVNLSTGYTGHIRSYGRDGLSLPLDNPMPHEFGHMMGLIDRYYKESKKAVPGWSGQIMAEPSGVGIVDNRSISGVLNPLLYLYQGISSWPQPSWNNTPFLHLGNRYYKEKK